MVARPHGSRFAARASGGAAAFSLAELMIALGILGIGLLFIAAALPVGVDYQRQSVDRTTGDAAAAQALKIVEASMRTSGTLIASDGRTPSRYTNTNPAPRIDTIFRPRLRDVNGNRVTDTPAEDAVAAGVLNNYEPLFKVRPLTMQNVSMVPAPATSQNLRGQLVVDERERVIDAYLKMLANAGRSNTPYTFTANATTLLYEVDYLPTTDPSQALIWSSLRNPAVSAAARFFPTLERENSYTPSDFFNAPQVFRPVTSPEGSRLPGSNAIAAGSVGKETLKLADRRFAWTAFYRRISYNKIVNTWNGNGPVNNILGDGSDSVSEGNPLDYEIIVVVTRRANANDRYAEQFVGTTIDDFARPRAVLPNEVTPVTAVPANNATTADTGGDRAAPVPWLVMFDPTKTTQNDSALPVLDAGQYDARNVIPVSSSAAAGRSVPGSRALLPDAVSQSATLTFRCTKYVGRLLPVGSVIIPAVNDDFPAALVTGTGIYGPLGSLRASGTFAQNDCRRAGFTPHRPDELPIYEVVQRPDEETVVVKNNGAYPWVNAAYASGRDAALFPCWVVPPAFSERLSSSDPDARLRSQPVYSTKSNIVAVVRKVVRLKEIQ